MAENEQGLGSGGNQEAHLKIGVETAEAIANVARIRAEFEKTGATAQRTVQQLDGVGGAFKTLSGAFYQLRGTIATLGLGVLAQQVIQSAASYQTLRTQLETVVGSGEKARRLFAQLQQYATDAPFSVRDLTDAYIRLSIQGLEPTSDTLQKLGNLAASTNSTMTDLVGAIQSALVAGDRPLRRFGISVDKVGEQIRVAFGTEAPKLVENSVGALTQAITELTGDRFEGATGRLEKNVSRAFASIGDQFERMADIMGTAGLNSGVSDLARSLVELSKEGESAAASLGRNLGEVLHDAADGMRFVRENADLLKATLAGLSTIVLFRGIQAALPYLLTFAGWLGTTSALIAGGFVGSVALAKFGLDKMSDSLNEQNNVGVKWIDILVSAKDAWTEYRESVKGDEIRAITEELRRLQQQLQAVDTVGTQTALERFQRAKGFDVAGVKAEADALREAIREKEKLLADQRKRSAPPIDMENIENDVRDMMNRVREAIENAEPPDRIMNWTGDLSSGQKSTLQNIGSQIAFWIRSGFEASTKGAFGAAVDRIEKEIIDEMQRDEQTWDQVISERVQRGEAVPQSATPPIMTWEGVLGMGRNARQTIDPSVQRALDSATDRMVTMEKQTQKLQLVLGGYSEAAADAVVETGLYEASLTSAGVASAEVSAKLAEVIAAADRNEGLKRQAAALIAMRDAMRDANVPMNALRAQMAGFSPAAVEMAEKAGLLRGSFSEGARGVEEMGAAFGKLAVLADSQAGATQARAALTGVSKSLEEVAAQAQAYAAVSAGQLSPAQAEAALEAGLFTAALIEESGGLEAAAASARAFASTMDTAANAQAWNKALAEIERGLETSKVTMEAAALVVEDHYSPAVAKAALDTGTLERAMRAGKLGTDEYKKALADLAAITHDRALGAMVFEELDATLSNVEELRLRVEALNFILSDPGMSPERRQFIEDRLEQVKQDLEQEEMDPTGALKAQAVELQTAFENAGEAISTSIEEAVRNWQGSADLLRAIVDDIATILLRLTVTKPLEAGITGLFNQATGTTRNAQGQPLSAAQGGRGSGQFFLNTFLGGLLQPSNWSAIGGAAQGGWGWLSSLFGFASGGSFTVPTGSTGGDNVPVMFRATAGERVTVTPRGVGGNKVTINNLGSPVNVDSVRERENAFGERELEITLSAVAADIMRNGRTGQAVHQITRTAHLGGKR